MCALLAALAGCAATPDCRIQAAAADAVRQGVAVEALSTAYPECASRSRELAAAYRERVSALCDAAAVWQAGYTGQQMDPVCAASGHDQTEAYRLGRQLAEFVAAREALAAAVAAGGADAGRQRLEQRRVSREIEQIVGIARIRGWPVPAGLAPIPVSP